jgi:hypothetical protein
VIISGSRPKRPWRRMEDENSGVKGGALWRCVDYHALFLPPSLSALVDQESSNLSKAGFEDMSVNRLVHQAPTAL